MKLLVGLPCPKQIKCVLDHGVPSSKESLLSCSLCFSLHSPSLTVTTRTAERALSIIISKLPKTFSAIQDSIGTCKYIMHKANELELGHSK